MKSQHKTRTESTPSDYFPSEVRGLKSNSKFCKFADWSGIPPQHREPETEAEFSRSIGILMEVLDTWKSHPTFSTLVGESFMKWIREKTPRAVGVLYQNILDGTADGRDVELFIRIGMPPYN